MRRLGRALGRILVALLVVGGVLWATDPPDQVGGPIAFDPASLPADLPAWLATREAAVPDLRAGEEKRIVWAGQPGAKTPLAVVYLHGFSASSEEIRPVPDQVAQALGANLFFTRLAGHGRNGAAMAEPTAQDWIEDTAEALAIGQRLGDRVLVIATSTGGTLAAMAARDGRLNGGLAGVVLISPNFGLRPWAGRILDLPWAEVWGPVVAGAERSFAPQNATHAAHWTTTYPTAALFPMAALVRHARAQDYSTAKAPLLLIQSPDDQVVSPAAAQDVLAGWGGPVRREARQMGPGDDRYSHVIAGDTLSPGQTAGTVALILDWAAGL